MIKKIPVVYFHSIAPHKCEKWQNSFLTLNLDFFKYVIQFFSENKYVSIFLDDYFYNSKLSSLKKIVFTFDDAYVDNWIYAFPILKKYKIKATIFINPETIDRRDIVRPTLNDYWNGRVGVKDLNIWGYLSWTELDEMRKSGLVDIQSHTLSHTKYFVSDKLNGFHNPFSKRIYPIWNENVEIKPYYIKNEEFVNLLPWGYPLFEEKSAVIANKIMINPEFNAEVIKSLRNYPWNQYNFIEAKKNVEPIISYFKKEELIIKGIETDEEYKNRVNNEIASSKSIIENKMSKEVKFCCWPHGDNSTYTHEVALKNGYSASTLGKYKGNYKSSERIDERVGFREFYPSKKMSLLRTLFRINAYQKKNPEYYIKKKYNYFKKDK